MSSEMLWSFTLKRSRNWISKFLCISSVNKCVWGVKTTTKTNNNNKPKTNNKANKQKTNKKKHFTLETVEGSLLKANC